MNNDDRSPHGILIAVLACSAFWIAVFALIALT
jgi:hypothetical protein